MNNKKTKNVSKEFAAEVETLLRKIQEQETTDFHKTFGDIAERSGETFANKKKKDLVRENNLSLEDPAFFINRQDFDDERRERTLYIIKNRDGKLIPVMQEKLKRENEDIREGIRVVDDPEELASLLGSTLQLARWNLKYDLELTKENVNVTR